MPTIRTQCTFHPPAERADDLADKQARLAAQAPVERRAAAQAPATEPQAVGALLDALASELAVAVRTALLAALFKISTAARLTLTCLSRAEAV
ncbi:hypothetical protein [Massilia niastensis]|uniref:hypothetical protein n=1 Tax=Massilia niastensis TaxID=544911 RepID=UPI00037FB642|nr:hypothetical protein [Massilia niastensis]